MAITKFIPQVWASKMIVGFRQKAIFASLCNREYEGQLQSGNVIHIAGVVDVAIKDYKAAGRTTSADAISDTEVTLTIDQEKNFDFYVDDIDKTQAAGSLAPYTDSAVRGLVEDADKFLAALAISASTPLEGAAAVTDAKGAFNLLRDLRKALNKAGVPQEGRQVVFNSEFEALLLDADSKLTSADVSGTTEGLRAAAIGRLLGFDLYVSENLPATDEVQVVAWHQSAIAYVSQIDKTEAMRADNKFADRLRGLHVYGAKVVRPEAVVSYTAAPVVEEPVAP